MKNLFKLTKEDWKGYWNVTKAGMLVSAILGVVFIGVGWFLLRDNEDEKEEEEDPE